MNTNSGEFVEEARAEAWMKRLELGEPIKIKGEELEVVKIERREVTLKLLSVGERVQKHFPIEKSLNRHMRREREAMERKLTR
jgi:hypothetical protein